MAKSTSRKSKKARKRAKALKPKGPRKPASGKGDQRVTKQLIQKKLAKLDEAVNQRLAALGSNKAGALLEMSKEERERKHEMSGEDLTLMAQYIQTLEAQAKGTQKIRKAVGDYAVAANRLMDKLMLLMGATEPFLDELERIEQSNPDFFIVSLSRFDALAMREACESVIEYMPTLMSTKPGSRWFGTAADAMRKMQEERDGQLTDLSTDGEPVNQPETTPSATEAPTTPSATEATEKATGAHIVIDDTSDLADLTKEDYDHYTTAAPPSSTTPVSEGESATSPPAQAPSSPSCAEANHEQATPATTAPTADDAPLLKDLLALLVAQDPREIEDAEGRLLSLPLDQLQDLQEIAEYDLGLMGSRALAVRFLAAGVARYEMYDGELHQSVERFATSEQAIFREAVVLGFADAGE